MQLTGSEDVTADSSLNAVPADDLPESSVNDGETNVTGLYVGRDKYDYFDHCYWRCEHCGTETTDKRALDACC